MDETGQIHYFIKRIRTSTGYFYFSMLQLILCLSILIYVLFDPYEHLQNPFVLWMEAIVAIIIFLDIIIRIGSEKEMYFKSLWNIFDLASFFVIVFVLTLFYSAEMNEQLDYEAEQDDIIGLVLIAIRYIIQIVRLILMIKKSHQNRQIHQNAITDIQLDVTEKSTGQEHSIIIEQTYSEQIKQFNSTHSVLKKSNDSKEC